MSTSSCETCRGHLSGTCCNCGYTEEASRHAATRQSLAVEQTMVNDCYRRLRRIGEVLGIESFDTNDDKAVAQVNAVLMKFTQPLSDLIAAVEIAVKTCLHATEEDTRRCSACGKLRAALDKARRTSR